jgi:phosphoribosylglycinamide formyltransferase-1
MAAKPLAQKKSTEKEDPRLTRLTKLCLALPKAQCTRNGSHATFFTGSAKARKVFAYFLNDHHGDGIVAVACKVGPGDNNALIAAQPDRFYLPAYIGPRGWVALRLDVGKVDWAEVAELVHGSHTMLATGTKARKRAVSE